MNESHSIPESNPPASAPPTSTEVGATTVAPATVVQSRPNLSLTPRWISVALAALAVLLVLQWWNARDEIGKLRLDLAHRLQQGDLSNTEAKMVAKNAEEQTKELQAKVTVLESKQVEAQSQQVAL